jgi:hypothetical protein
LGLDRNDLSGVDGDAGLGSDGLGYPLRVGALAEPGQGVGDGLGLLCLTAGSRRRCGGGLPPGGRLRGGPRNLPGTLTPAGYGPPGGDALAPFFGRLGVFPLVRLPFPAFV